jgi:hypothetical protein
VQGRDSIERQHSLKLQNVGLSASPDFGLIQQYPPIADRFSMANQKESAAMKCLRIYATPDGASHFDEVELPTTTRSVHRVAVPFEVSASRQASRVRLTRIPAGMGEVAWHTVPDPVLTVRPDGSVEYETSDGEVRHVRAGSFVLVEDIHGKGRPSRYSAKAQTVIWISPPNGLHRRPS